MRGLNDQERRATGNEVAWKSGGNLVWEASAEVRATTNYSLHAHAPPSSAHLHHVPRVLQAEAETSGGDVAAYELPRVFGADAGQGDLYGFVRPVVLSFLAGYHGTVFAYGQTGAGKTHTMQGPRNQAGIIPRALADLFAHIAAAKAKASRDAGGSAVFDATVRMSYLELYNEELIDLLDSSRDGEYDDDGVDASPRDTTPGVSSSSGMTSSPPMLTIRDNAGPVAVDGLLSVTVSSAKEAAAAIAAGERRRHVAATALNRASSRSHAVLCVRLDVVSSGSEVDVHHASRRSSQLTLVDLAGSERASTRAVGLGAGVSSLSSAWLEGTHINLGLLSLGRVVRALAASRGAGSSGQQQHVPWRDSKLTRLLAGALGGNSKAAAICCCSPAPSCAADTRNTLRFAERCALVTTRAVVNEHLGVAAQLAHARCEIARLKEQLAQAQATASMHTQRRRHQSGMDATSVIEEEGAGAGGRGSGIGPAEAHLLAAQEADVARLTAALAHERASRIDAEARLAEAMRRLTGTAAAPPSPRSFRDDYVHGGGSSNAGVRPLTAATGAVDALFADMRAAQHTLAHVRADVRRAASPPSRLGVTIPQEGSPRIQRPATVSPTAIRASVRVQDLMPADQFWAATLQQPWQTKAGDSLLSSPHWAVQSGVRDSLEALAR